MSTSTASLTHTPETQQGTASALGASGGGHLDNEVRGDALGLLVGKRSCRRSNLFGGVFQPSGRFNRAELGNQGGRKFARESLDP